MRGTMPGNRSSAHPVELTVKPRLFSGEPYGVLYSGVNRSSKP
jgi:hypothetical protein